MELSGVTLAERYRLDRLLGRGGMGEVWLARDSSLLRRDVAVKVLPTMFGEGAERRFQREAAILAKLQHPGITVVHDAGRHEGYLFIVMELLRGRDLSRLMAEHPAGLPVERVLALARQTVDALATAHDSGVIHRDLKPGNLFVQPADQLKICDFGLARTADATSALTTTGRVVGTPLYMSPEQCRAEEVDARTDLYSLGCVLFELLTGRPPFVADASIFGLMRQHVEEPPPRLRALRADLPLHLEDLVLALLAKKPGDRPDAAALEQELSEAGAHRPAGPSRPIGPPLTTGAYHPVVPREQFQILPGHRQSVHSVAFSPDGRTLASGSLDKHVRLWDLRAGEPRVPIRLHSSLPAAVAFSPDGRTLVTACSRLVEFWNLDTGMSHRTLKVPGVLSTLACVAFSPDGRMLATGADERVVRLWDVHSSAPGFALRCSGGNVLSVAFSPGGHSVAVGGNSRSIRLWHVPSGELIRKLSREHDHTTLAFSPDGRILATGHADGVITFWETRTGDVRRQLKAHADKPLSMAFSPDGALLATAYHNRSIGLWDVDTGEFQRSLTGHTGPVTTVAFSPDGAALASGSQDKTIRLWSL
ncbi:WD40 repeat domain-containing serine/threonine protein kinase [Streptomyces sp. NPDC059063]|uniref:WD40 repeat domain-containing serine/threonine protein kinase n=1 Tax=unclassified Streptomyces TaxID=2593676 RepID=UPI0036B32EDD